jgi:hypothetical protein
MRLILAILLLLAALVLAGIDWQATIGQGYAYRFSTLGTMLQGYWPEGYFRLVAGLKASRIPYLWDPIGAIVLSIPVSIFLGAIGAGLLATREKRARAR